jgi:hypothetical protein
MRFLRQSTASQEILLGPFVATADGTAQTGLTIANTDIKLLYAGGTTENNKNSGGGTHIAGGRYSAVLDATDTATVGILEVSVAPASGIPWSKSYYVLEEAIYDALFAASANAYTGAAGSTVARADLINIAGAAVSTTTAQLGVNVVQVSGDGTAADNIETAYDDTAGAVPWAGIIDQGTMQAGSTGTTAVLRAAASFADDVLIGATIQITGGTGIGQRRLVTDWVSATDTATVDTWVTTPDNTSVYKVYATAPSTGGAGLDAAGVRAAIGMSSANLDTQLSGLDTKLDTIDNFLDTEMAATLAAVDTEIATIVTAVGTTIPAALTTIDDFLDTEVAAIKAKTDSLTFTVANVLDANIQRINDVAITGDGSGTPFNV